MGFAGMSTAMESDHLRLNPKLPGQLTRIAFPVVWKGVPVYVELTRGACVVTNRGAQSLKVQVGGRVANIKAGKVMTFPMKGA
jgi:trehalose/maltose hydrolase-like predicted phosphorylase